MRKTILIVVAFIAGLASCKPMIEPSNKDIDKEKIALPIVVYIPGDMEE